MKTVQATFLLSIVCLLGCTSTHRLRPAHEEDYVSLNNRAAQKNAMVTFVDGRKIRVENLRMTSDSTYWTFTNRIDTGQIQEVRFRPPGGGPRQYSLDNDADQTDLYENINQGTRGRHAVLILRDGQELDVRQLWVTSAFTYWIDPQVKQQTSPTYVAVATSQIKEVRFSRRGRRAIQGLGFGLVLGALVGFAAGQDCGSSSTLICISRGQAAAALGFLGALLGATLGATLDAIMGNDEVYQIEHEKDTGTN